MGNNIIVTVVIATFNCESTIRNAIESVVTQSANEIELVIVDGNSTDQTISIIEEYSDHISAFVSENDNGIYDAWNKGVRLGSGSWFSFIGADDVLYPDAMQNYIDYVNSSCPKDALVVSSRVNLVTASGNSRTIGEAWNWAKFRRIMNIAHVGALHKRQLFDHYGLFDSSYRICGDYELLLRPRGDLNASYMPEITAIVSDGGTSRAAGGRIFDETFKAKVTAGGRSSVNAYFEKKIAHAKWALKNIVRGSNRK
ncbi:glycosyltransferase family 2 protein [Burkholderia sp. Bp8998]|uniref:glycosyltransferase family 2 protein n=1 Tax=Burkholderia sp. Bp8998 TaxID=2184557 RepID=UPI000F5937DB|nr:glycosyltransferase family 2 protein [Burkholderia sp. Bp8998]RQS08866.1 glycosyltransferase [Burkholderia sp. Bp8998]